MERSIRNMFTIVLLAISAYLYHFLLTDHMLAHSSVEQAGNISTAENGEKVMKCYDEPLDTGIRLVCIVTSHVNKLDRLNAVFDTWARKCDKLIVLGKDLSKSLDNNTNYIRERGGVLFKTDLTYDDRNHLIERTFVGYRLAGKLDMKWDWLLKADDDTFIHIRNLHRFLKRQTLNVPTAFGFTFKTHFSGGAGYVINRAGYDRIDLDGSPVDECKPAMNSTDPEDLQMSKCMQKSGVKIGDSTDGQKQRFHPINPSRYLLGRFPVWMHNMSTKPPLQGPTCCSKETISFHYVGPESQYLMEDLIDGTFKNN